MSPQTFGEIDFIRELRLRHWARTNYVCPDQRRETWHPIVLDEMHRRDVELAEQAGIQPDGLRYVPLPPTEMRILHPAHEQYPDPNFLRQARPAESQRDGRLMHS